MTRAKLIVVFGVASALVVGWLTHPVLTVLVGVLIVMVVGAVWRRRRGTSAALLNRWRSRAKKHHGLAHPWAVRRSRWAIRRNAHILLPSIGERGRLARWRIPITHLATPIIQVGRTWLVSGIDQHTIRFGGAQTGKSGELACRIFTPGAVMVTSTGDDMIRNTSRIRAQLGPVNIFNPLDIGGLPSTVSFGLLDGCEEEPSVAAERATDLLSATPMAGSAKNPEWVDLANGALAFLMHAAALGEKTMHHVQRWVANPDAAAVEVLHYLKASPGPAMFFEAEQFFNVGRPQSSICMTIMPALRWLSNPVATQCVSAGAFDVEEFLADRGTMYFLAEKDGLVAPLVTAFAGHIARNARRIANRRANQRLQPAFTMVLDEAPSICPLPLPDWAADIGKRNITMHIAAQSLSQLEGRWGKDAAGSLLTNCRTVLTFTGAKDLAGLSTFSALSGERHDETRGPLLMPAQFQQLPPLHAVVFQNGLLPVVGKPQMVWDRRDYRAMKRAEKWGPRWAAVTALASPFTSLLRKPVPVARRPMLALPVGGTAQAEREKELQQVFALSTDRSDVA